MSESQFAELDPEVPLALLPVRLEARYQPRGRRPTHLHLRIFPDLIHADAHNRWLSEREAEVGQHYWTSIWTSIWNATDAPAITSARQWLAAQTGPHRALWVATTTRPTNLGSGDAAPIFPQRLPIETRTEPVRAALLPDEWMVRLYDSDMQLHHAEFSGPVRADLAMAPTLSAGGTDATHPTTGARLSPPLAFLANQDLLWTVDFEQAKAVGMAVSIPIADVPDPVGALVVLGVRAKRDPGAEGNLLDDHLEAHWYSRGLDFVPQGTPTNNTDAGRSAVSISAPDIDELFEREASSRPVAPAGRALLMAANPALLYRLPSADSASLAFGRIRANPLDRVAHADWGEAAASWAMTVATGYGVLGRYLSDPLSLVDGSVVTGDYTAELRDWYIDWVRGGSLLPVLRCGEQPYGILPITHRPVEHYPPGDFEVKFAHYLTQLLKMWTASLPVAALDPDATDGRVGGTPTSDALVIADVLGAVPHPTAFQLRTATDHIPEDTARFNELMNALDQEADGDSMLDPAHNDDDAPQHYRSLLARYWDNRKRWIAGLPDEDPPVLPPNISDQLAHLELFYQEVQNAMDVATFITTGPRIHQLIDDEIRPLFQMREDATDAIPEVLWGWRAGGGLGANNVIRLVGTTFDKTAEPVHDLVTSSGDVAEIRATIERAIALLDEVEAGGIPPAQRERLVTSPAPLLAHLFDVNYRTVDAGNVGPVRTGLQLLLAMIDSPIVADPIADLERLIRECLGPAMYRIDAWVTAIAARRLAQTRRRKPVGLQIGGYGWLLDLKKSTNRATQGFVHAPSLSHAQTAAILRSGWSAYGTASGETPLSVDLSSARVRGGQWVLDGVRNGQDLAEVLGARFERYLHDAHLDEWIEAIREMALEARGSTRTPTRIVDGLLVARAASDVDHTETEQALAASLNAALVPVLDPRENARRRGVRRTLDSIAADLDAVADLTMAQSVHSLLQGNLEAASAAMAVTGGGDGSVPPITVTSSQRDAQLVSHRVVAMWEGRPSEIWIERALHLAEPRLVPWLEALLPAPARVIARVTLRGEDGRALTTKVLSLAEVGLTAVEAALLAGSAATQDRSRLGRVVLAAARARYGESAKVELAAGAALKGARVSIQEFGLLASAMLAALGRGRALRPGDLVLPDAETSTAAGDVADMETRIAATEKRILELIDDVASSDPARQLPALLECASLGITGSVRALETADREVIVLVISALKARFEPGPPDGGAGESSVNGPIDGIEADPLEDQENPVAEPTAPPDPVATALARLRHITGGVIPILPVFSPIPDPERAISASSPQRRRQVADRGHGWLRQAGRVRADLGAIVDFLMLAETVAGRGTGPYGLAQLPHLPEPWAAVDAPVDKRDRVSIVSLTGPEAIGVTSEPVAGFLFDGWTEGIPRKDQQTGVAVHFDAPTARPPQSILLSVVDAERGFSADDLADQLLHTVELAKVRALGPTNLKGTGHYLPAAFVPDDVVVSGGDS